MSALEDRARPEARFDLRGRTLREHTARGTIINGAFLVGFNALGVLKGFVVAAFLTASEYGVWGILAVGLGTLMWLKQVGINDKYVQQSEPDQEAAFQKAFTLELMVNAVFAVLLAAAVPLLVVVYDEPKLLAPGFAILAVIPALALRAPTWVYYRRMAFARQRALEAVDPVVSFVATLALAIAGAGYWSLVGGLVAGIWAGALAAVLASPYPLRLRYDRGTLREYVGFSWPLFVTSASGIVIAQSATLAGDLALGLSGVGAIALASSISLYAQRVDEILTSTLYPAICAVRDRRDLLLETFVKSNRLALMWGVPFGISLTLFAPDLVQFVLGERWQPSVVLLQAFGAMAAVNHIGFNWTAFFRAMGNTRPMAVVTTLAMVAFLAAAVPLLVTEGLDGFAVGMGVMTLVSLAARFAYLTRLFPGLQIAKHSLRAIAPTVPAVAAVLVTRLAEGGERTLGLALGELALYAALTVAATALFERRLLREVRDYLRGAPAARPTAVA